VRARGTHLHVLKEGQGALAKFWGDGAALVKGIEDGLLGVVRHLGAPMLGRAKGGGEDY
jgi:hypothetical protein